MLSNGTHGNSLVTMGCSRTDCHFMITDLKHSTMHSFFWSFIEKIGQQGIQFIITVILARLLLPEEFGLIAILMVFMAVAQCFVESGFGSALIQKQDASHLDECSIYYCNIVLGFIAASLLYLAAPWIALFYNIPILVTLTQILCLNLVINSFGIVQTTLLTKHLDFKAQMKVTLIANVVSGTIAVAMAYQGAGVWSLVIQSLLGNLLRTILLWFFLSWRPSWMFSFNSLKTMFTFGSKLLFSGLLDTLYRNLFPIIIGKFFTATDLGFYSRANQIQQALVGNISWPVARVTYPVFSSIKDDKPRLKRGVKKVLSTMAMVIFPLMIGMALIARPLVSVLLTEKWLPCVIYLQLLCFLGLLYPLNLINLNVLIAQGRSDLFLRLEIIKKVISVILILFSYRWGIAVMILSQIFGSAISYFLNSFYTARFLNYPAIEQICDFAPLLFISVFMGFAVYLVNFLNITHDVFLLFAQILTGICVYLAFCRIARVSTFMEYADIIRPQIIKFCRIR